MEAFPTMGLALQLKVHMVMASIPGPKVEDECWNSGLDARLVEVAARIQQEVAVAATLKSA
jgi:hypothetical protein